MCLLRAAPLVQQRGWAPLRIRSSHNPNADGSPFDPCIATVHTVCTCWKYAHTQHGDAEGLSRVLSLQQLQRPWAGRWHRRR